MRGGKLRYLGRDQPSRPGRQQIRDEQAVGLVDEGLESGEGGNDGKDQPGQRHRRNGSVVNAGLALIWSKMSKPPPRNDGRSGAGKRNRKAGRKGQRGGMRPLYNGQPDGHALNSRAAFRHPVLAYPPSTRLFHLPLAKQ